MPDRKIDASGRGVFNLYHGGHGPAVLLLHGMAASAWQWSRSIPRLEQHFTVYAPDMIGHGNSEPRRGVVSVEHHAECLESLIEGLPIRGELVLAGAAFGGLVAMELALR